MKNPTRPGVLVLINFNISTSKNYSWASPLDLIVSWAGAMANMHIVHKPGLDHEDLTDLFGRLKTMFEKLGVRESSMTSPSQESKHVDLPQIQEKK